LNRGGVAMLRTLLLCIGLCLASLPAQAADFYVDPVNGSPRGDGSAERPWRTIQEVFDAGLVESQQWDKLPYTEQSVLVIKNAVAPVRAGDTIWLRSGYHGDLYITRYYNSGDITLAAEEGHTPRLSSLRIRSGSHWTIRGLTISAEFGASYERRTLVDLDSHNWHGPVHDIVVEQCAIRSVADTSGWTADDWNELACNGMQVDGTRMTIRDNYLLNVNFGISVGASHSLICRNLVENFAGDGLRGLGDHCTFEYNTVKNCYDVNANHDDGFQSWSVGPDGVGTGEVVGIVLRGNTVINYVDPNQPHRGTLQGIGCFDGTYVDWVIENNVVITDHWHGITLGGARNCLVINNTVLDLNSIRPGPPWICIDKHKNGTPPVDCVVRNNLATDFRDAADVLEENNLRIQDPATLFVDPEHFDLHLLPGTAAIDAGSSVGAPALDRDRVARPQGDGIDIGAYEWHADDVRPVEEDGGALR
jgi:parallel beta-helix repeat protein